MKELKVGESIRIKCVEASENDLCLSAGGCECIFWDESGPCRSTVKCRAYERSDGDNVVFIEEE